MLFRLNNVALESAACKFHAELIVRNVDRSAVRILFVCGIIVRGRNGKIETIDSLRINAVYGDLKNFVFVIILCRTVRIVFMCNGIFFIVYRDFRFVCRMTEGLNTRNVLIFQATCTDRITHKNVDSFRRVKVH